MDWGRRAKGYATRDHRAPNREINAGLVNPTIKARLAEVATTPKIFTPAEFGDHMAAEIEKWGRVIKFAGLRAE